MFARQIACVRYQLLAKSQSNCFQKITCHRSLHLVNRSSLNNLSTCSLKCKRSKVPVISTTFVRYINTENTAQNVTTDAVTNKIDNVTIPDIPLPPGTTSIAEQVIDVGSVLNTSRELESLGLGSYYTPVGWVQNGLQFMHVTLDMPWWACIATATIIVRLLMFPVVISIQRYSARMQSVMPKIQEIQAEITEARKFNDEVEVAQLSHQLYEYHKKQNVSAWKSAAIPMIQAPIFLSFFFGLRQMTRAPMESFKTGGMLWFVDLTARDSYYVLPVITCASLFLTIELGTDSVKAQSFGKTWKYVIRAIPVVIFPFIYKFEGAILCYWVSTNMFSLCQAGFLKIPRVRKYFNIPKVPPPPKKKKPDKGFREGLKETWSNWKIAREMNSRLTYDQDVFEQAGRGPVPRTFKTNPLSRHSSNITKSKIKASN